MFDLFVKEKNSDIPAIKSEEICVSYKQLYQLLYRNQLYLQNCGYIAGEHVIIHAKTQVGFALSILSMLSLGTWVVPVNKAVPQEELQGISIAVSAKIMKEEEIESCSRCLGEMLDGDILLPDEDKCGIFHMTSGSTGIPKYCVRRLYDFMLESFSFQQIFDYKPGYKVLSLCPLEHSFASGAVLFNCFNFGGTLCIIEEFNPKKILKFIEDNLVNNLIMVPSMLRLFNRLYLKGRKIDSIDFVLVGSGVMQEKDVKNFQRNFGCHVYSNYGSSESGCVITSLKEWVDKSAGVAMPGVALKLCDDNYNLVTEGDGQLYIKCSWMFSGYYGKKDVFTKDGFFTLGDIARIDDKGNVFIVGRKENFVKINGKKVNCVEVEDEIKALHNVLDCKVIGCKKDNNDEYIKAYVEAQDVDEKELRQEIYSHLAKHKRPEKIIIVDLLPRNLMGKIMLNELV